MTSTGYTLNQDRIMQTYLAAVSKLIHHGGEP
jgi:hypothetical protein